MIANKIKLLSVLMIAPAAFGSIVFDTQIDLTGTGLGNVATLVTVNDNDGTAQGCVTFNGTMDVTGAGCSIETISGGNEQQQTQTRLLGDSGVFGGTINSANDIAIIFNGNEGGNDNDEPVTLDNLALILYGADGQTPFTASLDPALQGLDLTALPGIGSAGYRFVLDATQAAAAQAFIDASGLTIDQIRIGLAASISDEDAGIDTFFLGSAGTQGGGGEIPEPATLGLMGGALVGLAAFRSRKTS